MTGRDLYEEWRAAYRVRTGYDPGRWNDTGYKPPWSDVPKDEQSAWESAAAYAREVRV